jgi:type 1 glutamine amidotransferase
MIVRTGRRVVACWLLGLVSPALIGRAGAEDRPAAPLRTLLLTGGEGHDWKVTAPILRRILDDTGRFDLRVSEAPAGLTARTLANFDLLVDDYAGPSIGIEAEAAIADFVASGKGLVVTHGALSRGPSSGEAPAYWPARPSGEPLLPVQFLGVSIARPEHPIVRGLTGGFRTPDAIPRITVNPTGSEVVALALDGNTRKDEPVLVVSRHGKGRVVGLALGHDASAIHEKAFRAILARAGEWAATGDVTMPAESGTTLPKAGAMKGLVVTGGHDHHAAFYDLFEGYEGFPVDTAANAFKKDIRGKYDVLIMYDFTRDLDDAGKKNLRDFVEGGGGVVVLHHALLNYQTWTWWDDEVVGGSYRLSRAGTTPSSGVKDDQEIDVRPAGPHPVTEGLAPFHIRDEAYKNLRMSPKIKPLLTTDNPTSDTNLAWVGPDDRYRVVAIQLGHGPSAFGHPSYRTLVRNAVRWAAEKTK